MASKRTRATRKENIPRELHYLFLIGSGWSVIEERRGKDWIQQQWNIYGPMWLERHGREQSFAYLVLGEPQS